MKRSLSLVTLFTFALVITSVTGCMKLPTNRQISGPGTEKENTKTVVDNTTPTKPTIPTTLTTPASPILPITTVPSISGGSTNGGGTVVVPTVPEAVTPPTNNETPMNQGTDNLVLTEDEITHIRLVWAENPQQQAYLLWDTKKLVGANKVFFGETSFDQNVNRYSFKQLPNEDGTYPEDLLNPLSELNPFNGPSQQTAWNLIQNYIDKAFKNYRTDYYYHKVILKNLKPGTKYYFTIVSDDYKTREYHFITAPSDFNTTTKVLVGGDSRSNRQTRLTMNNLMRELVQANPEIVALVHGGDYVYNSGDWGQWIEWLEDHKKTFTIDGRIIPIIPSQGNHEIDDIFFSTIFGVYASPKKGSTTVGSANGGKGFYTFNLGSLLFFNLNSQIDYPTQALWMKELLSKAEIQKYPWRIANYHVPGYPAVKAETSTEVGLVRTNWVPVFESGRFDVAFESDGHTLKKTIPIKNGAYNKDGVIYMGEGGLGADMRDPVNKNAWYLNPAQGGFAEAQHHVFLLTATAKKLTVQTVEDNGSIRDSFDLTPKTVSSSDNTTSTPTQTTPTPTPTPAPVPTTDPCAGLKATFYDDAQYVGILTSLPVGSYNFSAQTANKVESISVPNGLKVELYSEVNFEDHYMTLTENSSWFWLWDLNRNDSVRITCTLKPGEQSNTIVTEFPTTTTAPTTTTNTNNNTTNNDTSTTTEEESPGIMCTITLGFFFC